MSTIPTIWAFQEPLKWCVLFPIYLTWFQATPTLVHPAASSFPSQTIQVGRRKELQWLKCHLTGLTGVLVVHLKLIRIRRVVFQPFIFNNRIIR